ncbi:sugar ABC transporter substrate-binding protein [Streptomyces sp. NPDC087270]|uniref:sugar ABC transporter substrate-binding protein n=1 Tax=Streptomyces sp. NPDC087270 TaxID=3365774 RepID=UPI003817E59D
MTTSRLRRMGRVRRWSTAGAVAMFAASLAACGSNSDNTSGSQGADSSAATGTGSDTSALAGEVAALDKPLDAYPVPTDRIANVSSLARKTIYYIPITLQAPQFAATQKEITAAASAAGLKVQVCDGKGTPTDVNACIAQATSAKAGAIVTDAIPYGLAASSLGAAQKAKIPVVINNQVVDSGHPQSATLAYVGENAGPDQQVALAKWTILDSKGKADVLINQNTDGPSPAVFVSAGKKTFSGDCANCKVTVNEVSSANFSLVPSSTSAALLKDPNVTYVQSQFEQFLQPTQAGIQSASKTGVKVITGAAELSSLKALRSGQIAAASGQATSYQAWTDIDAVLRMMLGSQAPDYKIPVRLFTKDSVAGLKVTDAALASGEWFGPTTFTDDFKKLWGVA